MGTAPEWQLPLDHHCTQTCGPQLEEAGLTTEIFVSREYSRLWRTQHDAGPLEIISGHIEANSAALVCCGGGTPQALETRAGQWRCWVRWPMGAHAMGQCRGTRVGSKERASDVPGRLQWPHYSTRGTPQWHWSNPASPDPKATPSLPKAPSS